MRGAMDRKDMDAAKRIFEQYSDAYAALDEKERQSVDGLWKFFLLEYAYLRAMSGESSFDAHQELESPGRETMPPFMRLRLQAAMHLADGASTEARISAERARQEAEDTFDAGTRLEELDLLDQLEAAIQPT